jgi:hypothetical protein
MKGNSIFDSEYVSMVEKIHEEMNIEERASIFMEDKMMNKKPLFPTLPILPTIDVNNRRSFFENLTPRNDENKPDFISKRTSVGLKKDDSSSSMPIVLEIKTLTPRVVEQSVKPSRRSSSSSNNNNDNNTIAPTRQRTGRQSLK